MSTGVDYSWRKPENFGSNFWLVFHQYAASYPTYFGVTDVQIYGTTFYNFGYTLPCQQCSQDYANMLITTNIGINLYHSLLKGKLWVWLWSVDAHNVVNRRLHKNIVSPLDICTEYSFTRLEVEREMSTYPWVVIPPRAIGTR